MPSFLMKRLLTCYMAPADDGADLGGSDAWEDDWKPSTPEERGDVLAPEAGQTDEDPNKPDPEQDPKQPAAPETAQQDPVDPPDPADPQAPARQSGVVPHARFNEVNEQRKQAERERDEAMAQLEQLRLQQAQAAKPPEAQAPQTPAAPAAPEFNVADAERAYAEALMEGEAGKAQQLREQINDHLLAQAEQRAEARVEARLKQEAEQNYQRAAAQSLNEEAQAVLEQYPYLNTQEGAEVMQMVCLRRDALIQQGKPAHIALREAAAFIAPRFAPETPPAKDSEKAPAATDLRQAAAVTRGAQASTAQAPTPVAGMGNRATGSVIDVAALTDEQFDALSEADKSRLRGG